MNELYLIAGILLLIAGIVDFVWTTLWVEGGAGPITSRLSKITWACTRRLSGDNSRTLSLTGPLLLSLTAITWILLFWSGWTLVFSSDYYALTDTQTKTAATWADRIYFAGYVFFTLGVGDIVANTGYWKITTIIATATGMLSVTLAVSYLISVLSAITQKRSFAQSITGVGSSGSEIVQSVWNGKDLTSMNWLLLTCTSDLGKLTAQHHAYPILHYYHSASVQHSAAVAVVLLDEALTILEHGVPVEFQPDRLLMKEARSSVESYLNTVQSVYPGSITDMPPAPSLDKLRQMGIPTSSDHEFDEALGKLEERRRRLLSLIQANASKWPADK
ncbi:two pore domain potassium channel family protein [Paenibacillus sambharensis]|uniref:Two pore domain potassium channel family protein n=1 Tax=Paenibacillus sambharensis TaxID=1803190 RepID=A0A2W1LXV7_9BACL|nr:potassium channel family protein [Paenibacillus sambharensis]PZD96347.1 two pore domain potassium channel family protein [Paenibacillus sambharensis]